jgi:serpin B
MATLFVAMFLTGIACRQTASPCHPYQYIDWIPGLFKLNLQVRMNKENAMNLKVSFLAVAAVALALSGTIRTFGAEAEQPNTPAEEASDINLKQLPQNNAVFAMRLYGRLAAQKGNLFFSPFGISQAMATTYIGAGGQTKVQMREALNVPLGRDKQDKLLPWDVDDLAAAYKHLNSRLRGDRRPRGRFQIQIANALWGPKGAKFKKPFTGLVTGQFGGRAQPLNFAQPDQAAKTINDWVARQTRDKVHDLVAADALSKETGLVLTNAIYFRGAWLQPFQAADTKKADFHLDAEKTVQADMMTQTKLFRSAQADGVKVLELPYADKDTVMMILLPEKPDGLAELEKKLGRQPPKDAATMPGEESSSGVDEYLKKLEIHEVHVVLPKFKFTGQFALADALKLMGMPLAFDGGKDQADFSGMSDDKLFISTVLHKAYVDVDENGTEAAAATAVVMAHGADEPVRDFVADHPFIFLIRDGASGSLLFMGRVSDPTK